MPVLQVGEPESFQAGQLVEGLSGKARFRAVPDGPLPEYPEYIPAAFTVSGDGVISVFANQDIVTVTGVNPGRVTLGVRVYRPDAPEDFDECEVEFFVYAPGSPGDVFGAALRPCNG